MYEIFGPNIHWVFLGSVVFISVIAFLFMGYYQRKRQRELHRDECLLCGSENVINRGDQYAGEYSCSECGYDTDLSVHPKVGIFVQHFRDISEAYELFKKSKMALSKAHSASVVTQFTFKGTVDDYRDAKLNESIESMSHGMTYLKDVFDRCPELWNMPIPGDPISVGDKTYFETALLESQINASIQEVERFVRFIKHLKDGIRQQILDRRVS